MPNGNGRSPEVGKSWEDLWAEYQEQKAGWPVGFDVPAFSEWMERRGQMAYGRRAGTTPEEITQWQGPPPLPFSRGAAEAFEQRRGEELGAAPLAPQGELQQLWESLGITGEQGPETYEPWEEEYWRSRGYVHDPYTGRWMRAEEEEEPAGLSEYERWAMEREKEQEEYRRHRERQEGRAEQREELVEQERWEKETQWQAQQQEQMIAWYREQQQAQLEMQRQAQLAQLRANPASWLEYASLAGETPAIQPWMVPMGQEYGMQAGQPIPGYQPEGESMGLPELTRPSRQYQSRIGPTAMAQFGGYEQARTGQTPEELDWRMWSAAPPSGRRGGITRLR